MTRLDVLILLFIQQGATNDHLRSLLVKVRELETLYQNEFEADVAFDAAMDALQVCCIMLSSHKFSHH